MHRLFAPRPASEANEIWTTPVRFNAPVRSDNRPRPVSPEFKARDAACRRPVTIPYPAAAHFKKGSSSAENIVRTSIEVSGAGGLDQARKRRLGYAKAPSSKSENSSGVH